MTPEGRVKALVKRRMKALHGTCEPGVCYYVYGFMPVQTGMGASTLDLLYCINGLFVAIETKAKGKKMTDRQRTVAEQITGAEGLVFVVDGEDSLDRAIKEIKRNVRYSLQIEPEISSPPTPRA